MESTPPGDAIPPAPQRAASAHKGARCGTGAGSTRPHQPRPGHTGRGTLAARYEGRARPGEGQRLTPGAPHNGGTHPPGDALPPPPQRATPARKGARCGAGAGSTCPHRPHPGHTGCGTLAARSGGRAAGEGTAPDTRRPSQRWKAPPPGDALPPPPQRATPARKGTRCGAGAGSNARIDRARDTRVAEPWLHAPEDERPGEGQRLTPDAPRNTGRRPPGDAHPPPPHRATHQRTNAPATGHPHPAPCS